MLSSLETAPKATQPDACDPEHPVSPEKNNVTSPNPACQTVCVESSAQEPVQHHPPSCTLPRRVRG